MRALLFVFSIQSGFVRFVVIAVFTAFAAATFGALITAGELICKWIHAKRSAR